MRSKLFRIYVRGGGTSGRWADSDRNRGSGRQTRGKGGQTVGQGSGTIAGEYRRDTTYRRWQRRFQMPKKKQQLLRRISSTDVAGCKMQRWKGRSRNEGRQMRDGKPAFSYSLWRGDAEFSRKQVQEGEILGDQARSRSSVKHRWKASKRRLSTARSKGRLRRGLMQERDHHDSDQRRLHRTGKRQRERQTRAISNGPEGTSCHGDYGQTQGMRGRACM